MEPRLAARETFLLIQVHKCLCMPTLRAASMRSRVWASCAAAAFMCSPALPSCQTSWAPRGPDRLTFTDPIRAALSRTAASDRSRFARAAAAQSRANSPRAAFRRASADSLDRTHSLSTACIRKGLGSGACLALHTVIKTK